MIAIYSMLINIYLTASFLATILQVDHTTSEIHTLPPKKNNPLLTAPF